MKNTAPVSNSTNKLEPYLPPVAVWALSVGSLGMAEYEPETDQSFYEVFKRADGLMYERKIQLKSMGAVTRD